MQKLSLPSATQRSVSGRGRMQAVGEVTAAGGAMRVTADAEPNANQNRSSERHFHARARTHTYIGYVMAIAVCAQLLCVILHTELG